MTAPRDIAILVHGAKGRMGSRIIACVDEQPRIRVVAALDAGDAETWISNRGNEAPRVVIDFSSDQGARSAVRLALTNRSALLVGTTALSADTMESLRESSRDIAVMVAPNTSLGVTVARHLVREAARLLGNGFDVDIVERHHRMKKDAPSGTAKSLAEASAAGGLRVAPERIHALRQGDVIGEHLVSFAGPGERLEVVHAATSRDLFARGALKLAVWLAGRKPGMHTVDDWIGERLGSGGAR